MPRFQIIEDTGNTLYLAYFDDDEKVTYFNSSYTGEKGKLTKAVVSLIVGGNPISEKWEGNAQDPQAAYNALTSAESTWTVIADQCGLYPELMKQTAIYEFSCFRDNTIKNLTETEKTLRQIEDMFNILQLAYRERPSSQDFGVYATINHYACVCDTDFNNHLPYFAGEPQKVLDFFKSLLKRDDYPDDPFRNFWIYNRIQEALEDENSGIEKYDLQKHGQGIDGLSGCPPRFV